MKLKNKWFIFYFLSLLSADETKKKRRGKEKIQNKKNSKKKIIKFSRLFFMAFFQSADEDWRGKTPLINFQKNKNHPAQKKQVCEEDEDENASLSSTKKKRLETKT